MDIKLAHPSKTTPEDLKQLANLSAVMLQKIRDEMLEPFPRKEAPLIPSGRLQELCGIDKTRMNRSLKKGISSGPAIATRCSALFQPQRGNAMDPSGT